MVENARDDRKVPARRRRQVVCKIGDAAISEGMPESRRGAWAINEPDDDGVANDWLADLASGKFAELRGRHGVGWMKSRVFKPDVDSQREDALLLAACLRWLAANNQNFTTVEQDDVHRMGQELVRARLGGERVGRMQFLTLSVAQWCVWTGRRETFTVDTTKYKVTRNSFVIAGERLLVRAKRRPTRVRFIDEATGGRIVALISDPAYRIAMRLAFQGCRASEAVGVECDRALNPSDSTAGHKAIAVLGKGIRWRDVQVDAELFREIELYRRTVRVVRVAKFRDKNPGKPVPTALLLNSRNGKPLTYDCLRREFKRAVAKLGLGDGYKLHWTRHAFAANWLAANTIIQIRHAIKAGAVLTELMMSTIMEQLRPELAELLGHASFETTLIYLSRAREAVLAQLAAFSDRSARLGYA